jgi:hypothetical protein
MDEETIKLFEHIAELVKSWSHGDYQKAMHHGNALTYLVFKANNGTYPKAS